MFFDGQTLDCKVAYTSYSRSGNTFLRKLLEKTSGIWTGSDGDLNYHLHDNLQFNGFTGEAINDDHTWFVKTHYPLCLEAAFKANKVICCVRNPFDVATSMFHFWATNSHNLTLSC